MSAVLITGANRGIGRAITQEFVRRGHRVVATARRPETLADLDGGVREGMITPEQVAAEVVDAAEKPQLPLRIPIGDTARALLAARRSTPDDVPFVP
jgi:NAD(P)-dependent dehydrogenase (short-subunit alcohol dehydrogenase family)